MFYPSSENKDADRELICAFVFAYADCWFSHEAAHMLHYGYTKSVKEHSSYKRYQKMKLIMVNIVFMTSFENHENTLTFQQIRPFYR